MKKVFLSTLAAAMVAVGASAQNSTNARNASWRKTEDPAARKNSVTVFGSVQGWGKYNTRGLGHVGLEYDRVLPHNLSVSAIGLYAPIKSRRATDTYKQSEIFTFAGAKVNYTLPVVRGWLSFRVGVGGGVGRHKVTDYTMGELSTTAEPALDTYIKPHLMVDAYWVLRATKWLDLRFSPLIASPSQLIVGGKFNAPYNDSMFLYFNMGTLGATVRF